MSINKQTDAQMQLHSEAEKIKAAYALNMCTVSVSQIVEYNDLYILEQEYEAILNNLNLEQMPKDEALLNILTELLNVITFFRIQSIRKDMIDKKYQQQMKDAIWSAIPSMSMIVAGSPLAIAFSLATQIGTGYMNYRKTKARISNEKEKEEMELQIAAIEQFNALRRELFTTAWRLAEEYQFPDRYRLTERQIKQYDSILMDTDPLRKYDRLEAIQNRFEAYLPFWYNIGHAASYIAGNTDLDLDDNTRAKYVEKAKEHFETFYRLWDENNLCLLREDQLICSYALEYADLLLLEENVPTDKIKALLGMAEENAGTANDILQLCAIGYLRIGASSEASRLLKLLVNEDYNVESNARLLSRLYVSAFINGDSDAATEYAVLQVRTQDQTVLFPMPKKKEPPSKLEEEYKTTQKQMVFNAYEQVYRQLRQKYGVLWNKVIPLSGVREEDQDELYANKEKSKALREEYFNRTMSRQREEYLQYLSNISFRTQYIDIINHLLKSLDILNVFHISRNYWVQLLQTELKKQNNLLTELQNKLNHRIFSIVDYHKLNREVSFRELTDSFFAKLREYTKKEIDHMEDLHEIDCAEADLAKVCDAENLVFPSVGKTEIPEEDSSSSHYISYDIFENIEEEKKQLATTKKIKQLIEDKKTSIILDPNGQAELLVDGEEGFATYFRDASINSREIPENRIAVINDHTKKDIDLIFTVDRIVLFVGKKSKGSFNYADIEYSEQGGKPMIKTKSGFKYQNPAVDLRTLFKLIEAIRDTKR